MDKDELLKMIADDPLGLLKVKPEKAAAPTGDERLTASFLEIVDFVRKNDREPASGGGIKEHQLAARLEAIRSDENKREALKPLDELGLLEKVINPPASIEEIVKNDDLGLLDKTDDALFQIRNVPETTLAREAPDFIARRRPCLDFDKYEPLFKKCHQELSRGERKLIPFVESKMAEGDFYVLDGVMLLLKQIYNPYRGNSNKINRRTYCIFENGLESNALLRSLGKALAENGRAISKSSNGQENLISESAPTTAEDIKTGFIYVLKSLSKDERIAGIKNLYKIGYSATPVEDRIKNASDDPTFLMAPVAIVSTYECYNFNPQKLEQLLHNFFGSACLNVDVFDSKRQRHMPREWFVAPIDIVEKAIDYIISGAIVNYRYDVSSEKIVLR